MSFIEVPSRVVETLKVVPDYCSHGKVQCSNDERSTIHQTQDVTDSTVDLHFDNGDHTTSFSTLNWP